MLVCKTNYLFFGQDSCFKSLRGCSRKLQQHPPAGPASPCPMAVPAARRAARHTHRLQWCFETFWSAAFSSIGYVTCWRFLINIMCHSVTCPAAWWHHGCMSSADDRGLLPVDQQPAAVSAAWPIAHSPAWFWADTHRLGEWWVTKRPSNRCREIWIAWSGNRFNVSACSLTSEKKKPVCKIRGSIFGIGTAKTGSRVLLVIS